MRAVHIVSDAGPSALELMDVEPPTRLHDIFSGIDRAVTIDVRAVAVSVPEVLQSWGRYQHQPALPFVPGSEVAGLVVAAPEDSRFSPGDRVAAFTTLGGMAELAFAPEFLTFPLPEPLSLSEGAALVANYHTAYFSLVTRGGFHQPDVVLIQGAAGGVGTAAVQVAAGLGARVLAIVSNERKARVAQECGAHEIYFSDRPWKDDVLATHSEGVDIVLDPVGGDRTADNLRVLGEGGRLVVVGFASGGIPEIKANRLLLKNVSAVGAGWGGYAFSKPSYVRQVEDALNVLVHGGFVRPVVGALFRLSEVKDAFSHVDMNRGVGKVVIQL
jgi:NADPH2:quinone reductase